MFAVNLEEEIRGLKKALSNDLKAELASQLSSFSKACETIIDKYDRNLVKPKDTEIYHAAYLYLKGRISEELEYLYDLVAYGLYLPIEVLDNKYIAADKTKLETLLNRYSFEAYSGNLLRETWLALLRAYFHPSQRGEEQDVILSFLTETYDSIYSMSKHKPSWLKFLQDNPDLLSKDPCRNMGGNWFQGNRGHIKELVKSLQISDKSWFWESMVASCIRYISNMPDAEFSKNINDIIIMLDDTPAYVDEGVKLMLSRYSQCEDGHPNEDLRNFSLSLWKNPRFRYCGMSKWVGVEDSVWQMVMDWVNEDYMRLFFDRIADRHSSDKKARLAAWLKYVEWARVVGNLVDNPTAQKDPELVQLFMMEEEAVYNLDEMRNEKLDLFIDRISGYIEKNKAG